MEDAVVGDHGPQPSFQAALTVEVCELLADPLECGYPLGQRRESALGDAAAGGADVDGHQPVDSGPVPLRTADLVAGALGRDPRPDVALLVPVETRRAHRHAEQEHRQLAAAELGTGDCLLAGRLLQQVTAVVVEQGVGDLHRGGAAEGCLFRLVDASRPGSEDAGVDQLVQGSVQGLRRVRARGPYRNRHQGNFRRKDHWASSDSWAISTGSRCSTAVASARLQSVNRMRRCGHSSAAMFPLLVG